MKSLFSSTKRFGLARWFRRPRRAPVPRPEVYHVPVWIGTQLTPFPVFLKGKPSNRRSPRDFYDEWE